MANQSGLLNWSKELPDKVGYYWWMDYAMDELPEILKVVESAGRLAAFNEEYAFEINEDTKAEWHDLPSEDQLSFFEKYGALEVYCYIPEPEL